VWQGTLRAASSKAVERPIFGTYVKKPCAYAPKGEQGLKVFDARRWARVHVQPQKKVLKWENI